MGLFISNNNKEKDKPTPQITAPKLGLLIGAAAGAVVMMIAGGLGYTRFADISLLIGLTLGFGGGLLYDQIKMKKALAEASDDKEQEDEHSGQ